MDKDMFFASLTDRIRTKAITNMKNANVMSTVKILSMFVVHKCITEISINERDKRKKNKCV